MIEAANLNQINDVIVLVERDIIVSPWDFWKEIWTWAEKNLLS